MMKVNVHAIIESSLTKGTRAVQSQIVKAVVSTFEGALQTSYLSSNNGYKNAMFKVVENTLGKMVRFGLAFTVSEASFELQSFFKTAFVA